METPHWEGRDRAGGRGDVLGGFGDQKEAGTQRRQGPKGGRDPKEARMRTHPISPEMVQPRVGSVGRGRNENLLKRSF